MLEQHLTESQVQEYADGRLSSAEKNTIEKHLKRCRECQRQVDFYSQMYQALAEEQEYVLPADFAQKISEQVIPESGRTPWLERIFWGLGVVLGLVMSFYWFGFEKTNSYVHNIMAVTAQSFKVVRFEWLPDEQLLFLLVVVGMLIKGLDFLVATLFTASLQRK